MGEQKQCLATLNQNHTPEPFQYNLHSSVFLVSPWAVTQGQ